MLTVFLVELVSGGHNRFIKRHFGKAEKDELLFDILTLCPFLYLALLLATNYLLLKPGT
jgi:hypothetical protein